MVALAVGLLVVAPLVGRWLPAGGTDASPAELLEQARAGIDQQWSGTVETTGTLQLPDADRFGGVAALFGEQTTMRVWWRDAEHWRVDRLLTTGETDIRRDGDTTLEWSFERAEATYSRDPAIRLPRPGDLVPPVLAERILRGVTDDDVSPLPNRRLAGESAAGLRVRPPSDLSSIDHVDLWTGQDSHLPLLVEVYAAGEATPSVTSRFSAVSTDPPADEILAFEPTATTDVKVEDVLDIADAANQYAPLRPPATAAGLALGPASDGAVGVYGEGTAQVIAIPLRDREAGALRDQLTLTPGVEQDGERTVASVGPLGVLLTGRDGDGGWLLAGTLTRDALERAGRDVLAGYVFLEQAG
ncbi:hypothetical protein SAMN04489844_0286 [Nocardioides exalbidus]|uniref:Sigma E regulatory protein, MucB/RseB n=1 Tax=Nocardioides exalbidus TaxID=402596 RepID=A0A1H4JT22_9ACTN|nr:hypothetical protein SAMN04489844_0286 [Nocardioides exalbidus]